APTVTNDGVTIVREIDLKDAMENTGAQLLREVATKTNDVAGDGTTTATILAQTMINEGFRNVTAGANPMQLKIGIEKAVEAVVEEIKKLAVPIKGHEDVAHVAAISSQDPQIGTLTAVAVKAPGFGDRRKAMLEDMAILTGGQVISEDLGLKLDQTKIEQLGKARRVTITKDDTTIVEGAGKPEAIQGRIKAIKS